MAELLFTLGRYLAIFGIFAFVIFGISYWRFRVALDAEGLSLAKEADAETEPSETDRPAVDIAGTVHYLRARMYETADLALQRLGAKARPIIIYPFYIGVWCFCGGLALMSATFGFVLLGN